jgi:hypothetical protein
MGKMQSVPEELVPGPAPLSSATVQPSRHSALVRAAHWITVLSFLALLVSGVEILISHPRFYWGENGNVLTPVLFKIPIPSSRSLVPTGYGYVLPDQNGWSRYLHFQTAWLVVLTGLVYVAAGFLSGHFRKDLLPRGEDVSVLQPAAAAHLPARHLRVVSLDHLDGTGDVSGIYLGVSGKRRLAGRATISAHHSFLRCHVAGVVSPGPRGDGLVCRIPQPDAQHDHGTD